MGEGVDGCGAETSRDATEGVILCNLGEMYEALGRVEAPERGAIHKDREDDGVVNTPPIGEVESPDGVAQYVECTYRRASPVGHDFDVV